MSGSTSLPVGIPDLRSPIVDSQGRISQPWQRMFQAMLAQLAAQTNTITTLQASLAAAQAQAAAAGDAALIALFSG